MKIAEETKQNESYREKDWRKKWTKHQWTGKTSRNLTYVIGVWTERRKGKTQKILRNNGQKCSKFDENFKLTYPWFRRNIKKHKKTKQKNKDYHNQITETDNQIIEKMLQVARG